MARKGENGKDHRKEHGWRDPNLPFPMSFPARMLLYITIDLTIINLIVFYFIERLSLSLVVPVIIVEIVALATSVAFLVHTYKLKC